MSSDLDYWLGRCYETYVVKSSTSPEIMDIFKKRMEANQNLKKAAQDRLSELNISGTNSPLKRCFISKKHVDFLKSALET